VLRRSPASASGLLTLDAIGLRPAFGKPDVTMRANSYYAALAAPRGRTPSSSRGGRLEGDTALGLGSGALDLALAH
jgi:hypothetical protein